MFKIDNNNKFFHTMRGYTDEEYLELLCRAEHEPIIDSVQMPVFTDAQFQKNTVGSSGEASLRGEGFRFYQYVKSQASTIAKSIDDNSVILDFGCGWGRMIRFYFKDIISENIFGIDVDPKMIEICQETLPCGSYSVTTPAPPTKFNDNTFDVIFAYSVFSHLRDDVALEWIKEFWRILKPDGIVVATTRSYSFLKVCDNFRVNPDLIETHYQGILSKCFNPLDEYRTRYNNGEFLYASTGGGGIRDRSFYGEAVIPSQYILKEWTPYLNVKNIHSSVLPQTAVTMQKQDTAEMLKKEIQKIKLELEHYKTNQI